MRAITTLVIAGIALASAARGFGQEAYIRQQLSVIEQSLPVNQSNYRQLAQVASGLRSAVPELLQDPAAKNNEASAAEVDSALSSDGEAEPENSADAQRHAMLTNYRILAGNVRTMISSGASAPLILAETNTLRSYLHLLTKIAQARNNDERSALIQQALRRPRVYQPPARKPAPRQ